MKIMILFILMMSPICIYAEGEKNMIMEEGLLSSKQTMTISSDINKQIRRCEIMKDVGWLLIVLSAPTAYAGLQLIGLINYEAGHKKAINEFKDMVIFTPALLLAGTGITMVLCSNKKIKKLELGLSSYSNQSNNWERANTFISLKLTI